MPETVTSSIPAAAPAAADRKPGAAQALALIFAMSLPVMGIVAMVPNLPQFLARFGDVANHEFLVPMIITIPSLCIALFSPLAGALADRWGRRRLLVWAALLHGVGGLCALLVNDLSALLATRLVVGLGEAGIMTCGNALLGDYFSADDRPKWLGVQSVVGSITATLLVLAGGALGTLSWQAPFALYALSLVVFVWLALFTWEPPRAVHAPGSGSAVENRFPWRSMRIVYVVTLLVALVYFVQAIQLGVVFSLHGAKSSATISILMTIASLGVVIGGIVFRKIGKRAVAGLLALVLLADGIGFIGLALVPGYVSAVPFAIFSQFGNGLTIPVLVGWALGTLDAAHRGRGMGFWTSCFFVGTFLSPLLVTALSKPAGGLLSAVLFVGIACVAAAALAWTIAARTARPAAQPG